MRSVFVEKCTGIAGIGLVVALAASAGCNPDPVEGSGRGARIFNYCAPCHGTDGHGNKRYGAPAIAGQLRWYVESQLTKFKHGVRGAHPADVEGLRMRPMLRVIKNEDDIKAVARYVSELRPAHPLATLKVGNAARGKQLWAACSGCHGDDARGKSGLEPGGSEALRGPALIRTNDWYLLRQLHKFKNGVRGNLESREGTNAAWTMVSTVRTLPEQDMRDIVAYIAELTR